MTAAEPFAILAEQGIARWRGRGNARQQGAVVQLQRETVYCGTHARGLSNYSWPI